MEMKKMTCIGCPKSCKMIVELEKGYVIKVSGNKCAIGEKYAKQEVEMPMRTLTTTVRASGLEMKMVPVRTSKPIPKNKISDVMRDIGKLVLKDPVRINDIIVKNISGTETDLTCTRTVTLA